MHPLPLAADEAPDDAELARRIAAHDAGAFERLMRRNNGALYRVARAILKNHADAEDVLQEAYLAAYRHMGEFRADARLSSWLTRIVVNQALARRRTLHRAAIVLPFGEGSAAKREEPEFSGVADSSPEQLASRAEIRRLLEEKIGHLPLAFRTVYILRDLEELSGAETAECLSISEATVRTRLFRARALLREALSRDLDLATADVFLFGGEHCDRLVAAVLARIGSANPRA